MIKLIVWFIIVHSIYQNISHLLFELSKYLEFIIIEIQLKTVTFSDIFILNGKQTLA